jgi:hypothetical protein
MRGNTRGTTEVAAHVHVVEELAGSVVGTVVAEPLTGTVVDAREVTAPTAAPTPVRTRGNVTVLASRLTRPVRDCARPRSDVP